MFFARVLNLLIGIQASVALSPSTENTPSNVVAPKDGIIHDYEDIPQGLDLNNQDLVANLTLFTRWRPIFHFLPPHGWVGDPCAPIYDHHRDEYRFSYQWGHHRVDYGNMTWGSAFSKDMVTWTDIGGWKDTEPVVMQPDEYYDRLGVFTGSGQMVNLKGEDDGTMTIIYTGARELRILYKFPYLPESESQNIATSVDGGRTFQKYEGNPVIEGGDFPEGWNVTGFRDPYFRLWPELDNVLGRTEPQWYLLMSGGIREDEGSRMTLYTAKRNDLTKWTYLGALWASSANETFGGTSEKIVGTYGVNFEVSAFFDMKDSAGGTHWYTHMGSEGAMTLDFGKFRWNLWSEGDIYVRPDGSVSYDVIASGVSDWGSAYAIFDFWDSKHNRRVQIGFIDEDLAGFGWLYRYGAQAQGWSGSLTLPREMFTHETHGILSEPGSPFFIKGSHTKKLQPDGTWTVYTYGIRPVPDVIEGIRKHGIMATVPDGRRTTTEWLPLNSAHFSISATISDFTGSVGFLIRATDDGTEYTKIVYNTETHFITVVREFSTLLNPLNGKNIVGNWPVPGHFFSPLLVGGKREPVRLTVFGDGSMIEVYANDRFTLTTRIYPSRVQSGKGALLVEPGSAANFENVEIWTNYLNVWPHRPLKSSSPLHFDAPNENNYKGWWEGY